MLPQGGLLAVLTLHRDWSVMVQVRSSTGCGRGSRERALLRPVLPHAHTRLVLRGKGGLSVVKPLQLCVLAPLFVQLSLVSLHGLFFCRFFLISLGFTIW